MVEIGKNLTISSGGTPLKARTEFSENGTAANREPIARFEKKIPATLACVWGEDEPVQALNLERAK